ncbi:mutS protein homolog 4-like [Vanessa cardui]|uniref:mutS protein homolog 4-like n=1 Tax=Vanessa cardui TaxID=171605 RepID=UPI001F143790|nr:mutS protein homolog 4-like [Vanessa cardui]
MEKLNSSVRSSMGPPSGLPPSFKRKVVSNSNSTKPESSSSGQVPFRILANDSAVVDTSDFCGYSGNRSARSTSTSAVDPSVILAISEGRGMARGEIGIAAIDLRHPHMVLCQFSDTLLYSHTLTKINFFNPIEIIVPHTFCEGPQVNQLYKLIKDHFPLLNLTAVQRRHFNDAAGRQNIQTLCAPQYSAVYLQVLHKFYALTAAAAVLKYVEYIQCIVFARESLKIEYHSSENTMIIDVGTATQLELVQPLVPSAGPTCCLLGVLGPTYTVGGIRALRAAILQPSCKKEFIEARLDAVQELIESESGLMVDLQDVIKKLSEIDKILLLCMEAPNQNMDKYGEAQLNQTLLLKTTMEMVPKLLEALKNVESGRLRKIKMDFENPHYEEIANQIRNVIQDDAHLEKGAMGSLQRCFAVKPEINGLLDVARRTYSELIEDIQKIVEQLSETYVLPIRLNQNVMKGFHIVLPVAPKNRRQFVVEDLPPIFIQVVFNGASVTMTTEELVVLDQQAKESLNEIQKMSNIVISSLLKELRPFMSSLYTLCEDVAELDILLALAHASTINSYIRPDFNNYLEIRNSVHPLLDYNSQAMPIPNDIYASPEKNFTIITGPNMGGKSIYIKQIAIMQIMAQLGCFLPATNAVLRLCDRIFSRIGFNDSVEFNASTFVIEMKETQHILKGLTSTSLVIIDELCRGTSIEEGTSIAWAICEELLMSEAFTFFTTHFIYLTRLQDLYHNVTNCHTTVKEVMTNSDPSEKKLVYEHRIESGITKIENYGLALAARTNLPTETINLAKELAELISRNNKPQVYTSPFKSDDQIIYDLNAKIRHESRKTYKPDELIKTMIRQFKIENPQIVAKVCAERRKQSNETSDTRSIVENTRQDTSLITSNDLSNKQSTIQRAHDLSESNKTSTSNDSHESYLKSNVNIHTSVKSSNELLNAFIDNTSNKSNDEIETVVEENDRMNRVSHTNNTDSSMNIISNLNADDDVTNEDEKSTNDDSKLSIEMDESESDIASALTQIIEENSEGSTNSEQDSNMSIDEELMRETLNEINEDLNKMTCDVPLDTIVLTPPLEFRDSN